VGRTSAGRWARLGAAVVVGGVLSLVAAGAAVAAEPTVTGVAGIAKDSAGREISYPLFDESGLQHDAAMITLTIDGKAVEAYCIDLKHPLKRDTYKETAWKAATVANLDKVQWLLAHSVPNVAATDVLAAAGVAKPAGASDKELELLVYAATQGAIWHYSDGLKLGAHGGAGYKVVKDVYDYLVAHAGSESEPAATLSITPANATGEIGAKLGPYTVKSSAPATLTASGGKIVDANGAEVTGPIANGGQFWLTSDTAGKVTVDASAVGKVPTGRVFTYASKPNDFQKIILAGVATTKLTAQATGSFTPKAPAAPAVPTLPVTGSSAVGAAIAGVLLLAGGGVLVMVIRRRRVKFTA
jgi:TQXA domain-containing protein/LPXTG-motif cell wall-anchored protein